MESENVIKFPKKGLPPQVFNVLRSVAGCDQILVGVRVGNHFELYLGEDFTMEQLNTVVGLFNKQLSVVAEKISQRTEPDPTPPRAS